MRGWCNEKGQNFKDHIDRETQAWNGDSHFERMTGPIPVS